jgi:hypothetical protein
VRFGIHNSSWLDGPDPAEAFEAVKVKAQWAENHGFVWFSVMDHMIQIPRVGTPDEPILEGWTGLAGLATVTGRIRLATLLHGGRLSQSRASRQDRGERRFDQPGTADARHRVCCPPRAFLVQSASCAMLSQLSTSRDLNSATISVSLILPFTKESVAGSIQPL